MRIAERTGDRIIELAHWNTRANEALVRGRLEDARLANERLLAAGEDQPIFQLAGAFMNVALLLADGRPDEARPIAEALEASLPFDGYQLVGAAAAAQGDLETVRTALAAWHSDGRPVPLNFGLPGRLWGLAECAYGVGDGDAAARLYEPLTPYDGQLLFYGVVFSPASAAYTLGLLAETMGDRDRALGHYTDALTFEQEIGAKLFAARTREALGRVE
jgi:tetratricopeptide (TPR) repeat protein